MADFEIKSNVTAVQKICADALQRGLEACGMQAVTLTHRDKLQGGTPVDTGRLRNSIAWAVEDGTSGGHDADDTPHAQPQPGALVIGTNVEYGVYIEEGTASRPAYHMLRNALVDGQDKFKAIIRASLEAGNV